MDLDYIRKNVVVCDGGENESDGIQNPVFEYVTEIFGFLIQNVHRLVCAIFCQAQLEPMEIYFYRYIFTEKFLSEISPTLRSVRQSASIPVSVYTKLCKKY